MHLTDWILKYSEVFKFQFVRVLLYMPRAVTSQPAPLPSAYREMSHR